MDKNAAPPAGQSGHTMRVKQSREPSTGAARAQADPRPKSQEQEPNMIFEKYQARQ